MPVSTLIEQSAVIMVIGLSVVFLFLTILIITVSLSHNIIHALGLDKPETEGEVVVKDRNLIAVIGAAIARFKAEKKQ